MLRTLYGAKNRPKSVAAIEEAVFNGKQMPPEMIKYTYRKLFHLNAYEYEQEPVDQLYTNLLIYSKIQEKQKAINKHGPD